MEKIRNWKVKVLIKNSLIAPTISISINIA